MINVVYLVLVITGGSGMMTSQTVPQANQNQCEVNKKAILKDDRVYRAYCIVGVK